MCARVWKRAQKVFIIKIKTKCNRRWAKMSVTDPPLGPLPNIVKARALYTNYNTFSKEKYVNMIRSRIQTEPAFILIVYETSLFDSTVVRDSPVWVRIQKGRPRTRRRRTEDDTDRLGLRRLTSCEINILPLAHSPILHIPVLPKKISPFIPFLPLLT